MAEALKVVVAGCGGISRAWLKPAREMPGVEIVGLVDLVPENAAARQTEFALSNAVVGTDIDTVVKQTGADVLWNLTVPEAHHAVSIAALSRGCHVLSEKPLADSMAHAQSILDAARRAGRNFAVMQNRRYAAPIRTVTAFLREGSLGRITTIHCDFFIGAHFDGFRRTMAHVLLLDMAIHSFDAIRMVSGAQPRAVYCREWNPPGSWYERDASAVAIFDMTAGMVATYRGSWTAEGCNTTWECSWRIVCENGTLLWNGGDDIRVERPLSSTKLVPETACETIPVRPFPGLDSGHAACIQQFMDSVRGATPSETDGEDNIHSLAMVFGAIASADQDRRVDLDSIR